MAVDGTDSEFGLDIDRLCSPSVNDALKFATVSHWDRCGERATIGSIKHRFRLRSDGNILKDLLSVRILWSLGSSFSLKL